MKTLLHLGLCYAVAMVLFVSVMTLLLSWSSLSWAQSCESRFESQYLQGLAIPRALTADEVVAAQYEQLWTGEQFYFNLGGQRREVVFTATNANRSYSNGEQIARFYFEVRSQEEARDLFMELIDLHNRYALEVNPKRRVSLLEKGTQPTPYDAINIVGEGYREWQIASLNKQDRFDLWDNDLPPNIKGFNASNIVEGILHRSPFVHYHEAEKLNLGEKGLMFEVMIHLGRGEVDITEDLVRTLFSKAALSTSSEI